MMLAVIPNFLFVIIQEAGIKRDYEVEIVLKVFVKDVEDEDDAIEYIDDFLYGLNDMVYSTDEWDDHYDITSTKVLTIKEA